MLLHWQGGGQGEKHGLDIHQTCLRALPTTLLRPTHVILVNGLNPSEPSFGFFNVSSVLISKKFWFSNHWEVESILRSFHSVFCVGLGSKEVASFPNCGLMNRHLEQLEIQEQLFPQQLCPKLAFYSWFGLHGMP